MAGDTMRGVTQRALCIAATRYGSRDRGHFCLCCLLFLGPNQRSMPTNVYSVTYYNSCFFRFPFEYIYSFEVSTQYPGRNPVYQQETPCRFTCFRSWGYHDLCFDTLSIQYRKKFGSERTSELLELALKRATNLRRRVRVLHKHRMSANPREKQRQCRHTKLYPTLDAAWLMPCSNQSPPPEDPAPKFEPP